MADLYQVRGGKAEPILKQGAPAQVVERVDALEERVETLEQGGVPGPDGRPVSLATTERAGLVKPDGVTVTVAQDGVISAVSGSAGVTLSDAVDSGSSVTAASSKAVKIAYDKAVEASGAAQADLTAHAATAAATDALGHVKPDGTTVAIAEDGALSVLNSPLWAGRAIYASTTDPDPATGNVGDFWLKIAE